MVSDTELSDKCWPPPVPWTDTKVPTADRRTFVSFRPDTPEVLSTMLPLIKQEPVPVPDTPTPPLNGPESPLDPVVVPHVSSEQSADSSPSTASRPPEVKQEASFNYSPVPMKKDPDTKRLNAVLIS